MSISVRVDAPRGALGKRKDREPETPALPVPGKAEPGKPSHPAARLTKPAQGNKLLAGYLAHEFLTHGTLLGKRLEPSGKDPARADPESTRRYAEASWLLMADGAHIPGVVNPTQLGRWLQIEE